MSIVSSTDWRYGGGVVVVYLRWAVHDLEMYVCVQACVFLLPLGYM